MFMLPTRTGSVPWMLSRTILLNFWSTCYIHPYAFNRPTSCSHRGVSNLVRTAKILTYLILSFLRRSDAGLPPVPYGAVKSGCSLKRAAVLNSACSVKKMPAVEEEKSAHGETNRLVGASRLVDPTIQNLSFFPSSPEIF